MKLRLRLALTAMAAVLPVVVAMAYFQQSLRERSQEEVLEAATLARVQVERSRCEASPETWRPRPSERGAPPPRRGEDGRPPPPRAPGGDDDGRPPPPRSPRGDDDGRPPAPRSSDEGAEGRPPRQGGPRGDDGARPRAFMDGPDARGRAGSSTPSGLGPSFFEDGRPSPGEGDGPGNGGRVPARVEHFPYDARFVSLNPRAPALSEEMKAAALDGTVVRRFEQDGRRMLEVLLRMPWEGGPCAFILARREEPPSPSLLSLPPLKDWSLLVSTVVASVVLALGPVVRRIRMLTEDVRASARSGYEQPVAVRGRDEIADLARAFQEARAEIQARMAHQEAREQGLRDFLANTTHDVMTPLTVLQGHLSAMQQRVGRGERVAASEVASAMSEAHYMASLVHNLAAATRLEAGAPHVQRSPVDLNDVVGRVLGRHQPIARQQRISLESGVPAVPVRVLGDVTLIEQAVSNVVGNGVRYGREEGHVAVVLESTREGRFHLRVIDDGPGIPEDERTRLLARGMRGNAARTRAPEGQGLGLHIAHDVAQAHGWALTLSPSEYGGLEVCFSGEVLSDAVPVSRA
ncbi:HAMP domain-containing histidine kinase [Myxococcus sp. K38C18041901]|uniref:sensor histidine kinase n=1 Tax=Myxococcus guangdongensis TaxID=2906760 RepID=UPI0020A81926|nr:ATP-binding protein [Myxococcus guangdongensis]MCP3061792.1 HAMP domain-containing histidine kinase [Myxococcus guangdongensis]